MPPVLRFRKLITRRQLTLLGSLRDLAPTHYKQYHSINGSKSSEFSVPRLDYTLNQDVARSNWMITKLSKEGRIFEAHKLFDKTIEPDVISWTALISGYVNCGMMKEARELFDRVDAKKDVVTWTAMINGYVKMSWIFEAEMLFNEMPEKNVFSWNTMIDGYVKCGRIDRALWLFDQMEQRNVVTWNMIIAGLAQCGRIDEAKKIFDGMPERSLVSWTSMVDGLSRNGRVDEARVLFDRIPEKNVVSWNAMITGYMQNVRLNEALDLFEKIPEKNISSWNTMIMGCIGNGDLRRASRLFSEMPERNVVSWTTMIKGFVQDRQSEEALKIFLNMLAASRAKPNEGTFASVLAACGDLAGLSTGKQIHQVICKTAYHRSNFVISALISMYSKCGDLITARKLFDDRVRWQRDLVSWNSMIAAYAHHGCGGEAMKLFEEMQNMGLKANDVSYVGLLAACSHAGLLDEGLKYFDRLVTDRSIKLREDHFTCLIDLFGRAGGFREAMNFVAQLPTKASACDWGAFLAGCNVHGNADVGEVAAKKLLEAEPENAGSYMLLSNIYTIRGKWKEAAKLRRIMKDKGLKKQPGCSWIDVGNQVLVFLVGDKNHCETELIHSLLQTLHAEMKRAGSTDSIID